jgi:hypothetical protein
MCVGQRLEGRIGGRDIPLDIDATMERSGVVRQRNEANVVAVGQFDVGTFLRTTNSCYQSPTSPRTEPMRTLTVVNVPLKLTR